MTRARFLAEQRAMLAQWRDWCARERDAAVLWDEAARTYEAMRQILETRHSEIRDGLPLGAERHNPKREDK